MALEQEIGSWLEQQSMSLNLHDAAGRRALLFAAGLSDLQNAFDFEGATGVFCRNLTQRLWQHGILTDGRDPLIALLEAAKTMVGMDRQAECAALIDRLRHAERDAVPSASIANRIRRNRFAFGLAIPISLFGIAVGYHLLTRSTQEVNQFTTDSGAISVAQNGGTAIQNNYGVPPELFAEYVKNLALTESLVAKFLESLQEQKIPREQWEEKLQEIAEQYKELVQRLELIDSEDPQVVALKTQARQAIEEGKFDAAEALLNQAEARDMEAIEQLQTSIQEQQAALKTRRLSAAETNADNARLQHIQLHYAKAADYWRQAAALLPESEQQTRGEYLNAAGYDFDRVARYADALSLFEQSLAIRREIGDKAGEGTTLNNISQIYQARGDYATALTYVKQSLAIAREIRDKAGEGLMLNNLSQIYDARGDYTTALTYLEQSLAIAREIGDKTGEGTRLNNIGRIYQARGDSATALTYLEQSLAIHREVGSRAMEGTTLNNLSQIYDARGDSVTALTYLEQSLAIHREVGNRAMEGTTLNNIGQIYQARGDSATALTYLEQSLAIHREVGSRAREGATLNNLSQIYDARGESVTALTYLEQSLAIHREVGNRAMEGTTLNNIGQIYQARGDSATALTYLEQSLAISREIGDKTGEGTRLNNIGQIYQARGDYETALTYLEQSLAISREAGNKPKEGVTCWNIGLIYEEQGDLVLAEEYIRRSVEIAEETGHPNLEKRRAELERIRQALQQEQASGGAE